MRIILIDLFVYLTHVHPLINVLLGGVFSYIIVCYCFVANSLDLQKYINQNINKERTLINC